MMKYLAIILLASLTACGDNPRTGEYSSNAIDPGLYKDTETGCEYLARGNNQGGLTPRMDATGHQICRK